MDSPQSDTFTCYSPTSSSSSSSSWSSNSSTCSSTTSESSEERIRDFEVSNDRPEKVQISFEEHAMHIRQSPIQITIQTLDNGRIARVFIKETHRISVGTETNTTRKRPLEEKHDNKSKKIKLDEASDTTVITLVHFQPNTYVIEVDKPEEDQENLENTNGPND